MTQNEENLEEIQVKILPLDKTKVMVQILKQDREVLIDLIQENYSHSVSRLAERIGMHGPNVYNALNGSKTVSLAIIDKIMSAIGFQADLGLNNTIIISKRKETEQVVVKPKSIFDDMPVGMTIEDVKPVEAEQGGFCGLADPGEL